MGKRKTTEQFIEDARKVYGDKYDYSKSEYIRRGTNLCIICHKKDENGVEHGEFWQNPHLHIDLHRGCPKCNGGVRYTKDIFISKAKNVHGDKYDYSKVKYINSQTKVCIVCPKHGEFWQKPNDHLQGCGCSSCANNQARTTEQFIKESKQIHGNKYDYSKTEYINLHKAVKIVCPTHGVFTQEPTRHLNGCGCPKCNSSSIETQIRNLLEENNITFEEQKKFPWLRNVLPMRLDFYLPKQNIAIECQGEQHFRWRKGGSFTKERVIACQNRDKLKKKLCNDNNIEVLYFSNLKMQYPYEVITDKNKLLNKINKKMNLYEELEWRGLIQSTTGNVKKFINEGNSAFYVGTDPTSPAKPNTKDGRCKASLHVGHLLAFVVAKLLQSHGHKPIILVGEATASLGDPSGKAEERKLLSREQIAENTELIMAQIRKIVDFENGENKAMMVNNLDWTKDMTLLDFARTIGKSFTLSYLLAKESIKMRMERESSISLCEALYGPMQGNDFLHLYDEYNCKMEIGGSDQLGNILNGTHLIQKERGTDDACGFVWPLVTRADGTKFGKSAEGKNVWLDAELTSPYEFYQFWLNQSDDDSEGFIKKFTLLPIDEIQSIIDEHKKNPQERLMQKTVAKELTIMLHGEEEYNKAIEASKVMFGGGSVDTLKSMDWKTIASTMSGVKIVESNRSDIIDSKLIDLCVDNGIIKSKREFRDLVKGNGISLNREKVKEFDVSISVDDLLNDECILISKGKKTNVLVHVV